MVDARLPDGSRVNAIIPPLALRGPDAHDPEVLARPVHDERPDHASGRSRRRPRSSSPPACKGKLNILISGGTGTGKTTTLNAMSAFVPDDERIVTIEDAAELQLQQEHVITLESRPPNIEGQGEVAHPRARPQRAAHAPRPDHRRRGPRRRDARHAPGDEHGPRGLADDDPRELAARRALAASRRSCSRPASTCRCARSASRSRAPSTCSSRSRASSTARRRITHITEVLRMESDVITLQDIFQAKPPDEESAALAGRVRLL